MCVDKSEDHAVVLARGVDKLDASLKAEEEVLQAEMEAYERTKVEVV